MCDLHGEVSRGDNTGQRNTGEPADRGTVSAAAWRRGGGAG
jgi:hypothetical protein